MLSKKEKKSVQELVHAGNEVLKFSKILTALSADATTVETLFAPKLTLLQDAAEKCLDAIDGDEFEVVKE